MRFRIVSFPYSRLGRATGDVEISQDRTVHTRDCLQDLFGCELGFPIGIDRKGWAVLGQGNTVFRFAIDRRRAGENDILHSFFLESAEEGGGLVPVIAEIFGRVFYRLTHFKKGSKKHRRLGPIFATDGRNQVGVRNDTTKKKQNKPNNKKKTKTQIIDN